MGTVMATVNMPHGLSASAFTTMRARTARMMIMMRKVPMSAMIPGSGQVSERIRSPSERPSRRIETKRTMKSCTAPAITTPARIQSIPGR